MIICNSCGRDINQIGQDNVSYTSSPLCEDCSQLHKPKEKQEREKNMGEISDGYHTFWEEQK